MLAKQRVSIYISPGLSIQSLFTYICVLSLFPNKTMFKPKQMHITLTYMLTFNTYIEKQLEECYLVVCYINRNLYIYLSFLFTCQNYLFRNGVHCFIHVTHHFHECRLVIYKPI